MISITSKLLVVVAIFASASALVSAEVVKAGPVVEVKTPAAHPRPTLFHDRAPHIHNHIHQAHH